MSEGARSEAVVGARVERLVLENVWLVDAAAGREGPASLEIEHGRVRGLEWHSAAAAREHDRERLLVVPGLIDLHAHLREPGGEDAETISTGLAAAAHGGFTTVCLMPNTQPALDHPGGLAQTLARAVASGSFVRVLTYAAATEERQGTRLTGMARLAAAGAIGFSDDGLPLSDPGVFRAALLETASTGALLVEHAEDPALADGAEAHDGLAATILGLRGAPRAAEVGAVARDLAILADTVRSAPPGVPPRLHLTHLSCAESIELVRRAKADGLPITCDVTPHHLTLHDGWLGGDRRYAWDAASSPWAGEPLPEPPYHTSTRVNPPLRNPGDALALAAGIADGTVDAIATDHAPHAAHAKDVEFGDAPPGISSIETALGLVLEAVDAGVLRLVDAVRALTAGPAAVLALSEPAKRLDLAPEPGVRVGELADLVVLDRRARWRVTTLRSRSHNTPLWGRDLPGRVLLTVARGHYAHVDQEIVGGVT